MSPLRSTISGLSQQPFRMLVLRLSAIQADSKSTSNYMIVFLKVLAKVLDAMPWKTAYLCPPAKR